MRTKKSNKILKSAVTIMIALIVVSGLGYAKYNNDIYSTAQADSFESERFLVKKGENLNQISSKLKQQNLIKDEFSFKVYAKLNNLESQFKPGVFEINHQQNSAEILATLTTSTAVKETAVLIPEGSTVIEIDQRLANLDLIKAGEFSKAVNKFTSNPDFTKKFPKLAHLQDSTLPHTLEGYLFPDTYFVNPTNFSNEEFINKLLNNFLSRTSKLDFSSSKRSLAEIINVAAMIEEEANKDVDRPLISDIIWKRLDIGMTLGIDATLLYLKNDREIDFKDLQEDSPYNTRKKQGLPPGPITNPGLKSIESALNPEKNDYYYYLTGRDGKMYYGITLEDHNRNKAMFLR